MPHNPLFPTNSNQSGPSGQSTNGHGAQTPFPHPIPQTPVDSGTDDPQRFDDENLPAAQFPIAFVDQEPDKPAYDSHANMEDESIADEAPDTQANTGNPATSLIRQKLDKLYADEPSASGELQEVEHSHPPRSKHQQFMYDLSASGKSLAQIQTEWHNYYQQLPDDQKHEVWQEFYEHSAEQRAQRDADDNDDDTPSAPYVLADPAPVAPATVPEAEAGSRPLRNPLQPQPETPKPQFHDAQATQASAAIVSDTLEPAKRSPADIKRQLLETVSSRGKLSPKHHLQSLLFGLGFGTLVLVIVLFSFFNEIIIAPFIQPSRKVNATPIIVSNDGTSNSTSPEVIIPKINLEIPLDFSVKSTSEAEVETALENGIVHYPTTVLPGQQGNTAFFGHSSNNIFNPGKYKFAFVLLHELVPGDTFYLTRDGVSYAYQVFDKRIVKPNEVSVLNPVAGKKATATLITCDPPGTSINRLVVWGEQISPDPSGNTQATPTPTTSGAEQNLPGNGPTLWRRLINFITGN